MALKVHTVTPFVIMGIGVVGVSLTVALWPRFGPTILINETPSEPVGFYRLIRHPDANYQRGMYAVFPVPREFRDVVYGRGWLRDGIPFLKEVLGVAGDRVCIEPDRVEVNGGLIGPVYPIDSTGAPLPQHLGCFVIPVGCFFPASRHLEKSFDGRYFGALPLAMITGEARPVWTF